MKNIENSTRPNKIVPVMFNNLTLDKIMLFLTSFILPISIVALVLFFLWPRHVIDIHSFEWYEAVGGDRTMKSYQIKAGDIIEYEVKFTKYIDVSAEVTTVLRQIDNGYLYPYPTPMITRMPVGSYHYKTDWPIPRATPKGRYVIVRTYRHFVNVFQTVTTTVTSNEFDVVGIVEDQRNLIKEGNTTSTLNTKILKKLEEGMKK